MKSPLISEVAAYWNRQPCNLNHSTSTRGTKKYFDEVEQKKYKVEPHIPEFADFSKWSGKRVLEIGMGIGTDAINFARAGAVYTGIELSVESLNLARQRFELYNLTGKLLEGDVENLKQILKGEVYDLVYSFGVLHHTTDIKKALREIYQVCHENSQVKLMLYAKNSWKNALIQSGLSQPEAQPDCPIANTYTREEIEALLKETNFLLTNFSQKHIFPYEISEYKKNNYIKESWFEVMPPEIFRALENHFGWHLLIDAKIQH
jgi:ubiquinone/menaquinone biosynthesis C-methylase UbiE